MMLYLTFAVFLALGVLAFLGVRWAYFTFVGLGLLFFPARVGFHFHPQPCECALNLDLALFSLTNYGHIWRFGVLFLLTAMQLRRYRLRAQLLIATAAVMAMGIYVEAAEGITGNGHCRLRDLVPDAAGALAGALVWILFRTLRKEKHETQSASDGNRRQMTVRGFGKH
jgi:hypothetical protein